MKIINMIKRCMISLFLINFSFLLSANGVDCDTILPVEKYNLNFYVSIIDGNEDVLKINKIESKYSETIVIQFRCVKDNGDCSLSIKNGSNPFDYSKYGGVKRVKITHVGNKELGNEKGTVFLKSDIRGIYKGVKNRKETRVSIEEKETSIDTIKSELKEPSRETIILNGIKAVDNGEFVEVGSVINESDYDVILYILNEDYNNPKSKQPIHLKKGDSEKIDRKIRQITVKKKKTDVDEIKIWSPDDSRKEWAKNHKEVGADKITNTKQEEKVEAKEKINKSELIKRIKEDLEKDNYWSDTSINELKGQYNEAKKAIEYITDTVKIKKYVDDNKLKAFVDDEHKKYKENKEEIDKKAEYLMSKYRKKYDIEEDDDCKKEIKKILEEKQKRRHELLYSLSCLIGVERKNTIESPIISIVVIVLIVIILIVCLSILSKKKKVEREEPISQVSSTNDVTPAIVVRKTATSILKKQCLDDVINNNSYLKIESVDFCDDSAVRCIYIKNTCIKEIYNMYAEDLRNPNNPKEDGCMVLGRWIYDEQANEYSVSLEEIVQPGDDAIFQEYELNFGGKIKLRVAERLRKLRKESNLQYDLTCWVHSHPGLGVFFSNSDSSVQMQLKHSIHPNFLTAIVVDILTPEQDFGIFTFKRDSSINSRNDLKKMYSLEELYKWAVESDRNSYKPEDHYNVLSKAKKVCEDCSKVMLSNGAIIDVSAIVMKQNSGLVGLIYGYKAQNTLKNEYVVCSVENNDQSHENELLGCLIIGTHCSIPSIKKAIVDYMNKIKFIMFYSLKDETITTIPITNNELCMEEKYYSEEKLNDLKIWTRRKR